MTHSEQEEILRRALHAVADAIEPAPDGLERIRERLSRPRPLAVAWLMAGWTGLALPLLLRIEPVLAGAAGRLSERLGAWLRLAIRSLRTAVELVVNAARMLRPGSGTSRHEKLRSAVAFGAAALIGAAGGFALSSGLPQQMISAASSFISPPGQSHHGNGNGHNSGLTSGAQHVPGAPSTGPNGTHKPGPAARPTCSPTPTSSPNPSPSSSSPTSTPPTTPTSTPPTTPTSTPPTTPTPTPSQTSSGVGSSPAAINSPASTDGASPTATPGASRAADHSSGGSGPAAATTPATGVSANASASAGPSSC
jgi:hypothetical protein